MKIVPLRTIDTSSMSTVEYVSAKEVAFEVQTLIERGATTILIDDDRGGNGHFVIHHDAPAKVPSPFPNADDDLPNPDRPVRRYGIDYTD